MGISIDTKRAWRVRTLGDLTVIFTWINNERAMVLLPTYRKGAPWYVVMDSAAHQYVNPSYMARQSIKAAEVLGMQGQEIRIATILADNLEELVTMPGEQEHQMSRATYGEIQVKADGKLIGGEELRVPVGGGASYG